MESGDFWRSIIIMAVLVACSAYFSATETAFTSLNRIRMKNRADSGDKSAQRVLKLEEDYDNLLTTILIGNNLVNIGLTAVATVFFVKLYGDLGPTIATAVITVIVLIFGEITPKGLAKEHSEMLAIKVAPLIGFLKLILTPLNWIFAQWKKLVSKMMKTDENPGVTEDELMTIVDEAEQYASIGSEESSLIKKAIVFGELDAWDVLTPRVDIEAIELTESKDEIDQVFSRTGFSRIPVYEDELDGILGVLNQKDFYNYIFHKNGNVASYVKPVVYVAGSMKVSKLLKKLQQQKCRMAIIVDEYGGTAGLVTAEDIVEELVGEIYDESDPVATQEVSLLQNGSYRVQGNANIEKILDYFGVEEEIDANTVNGWVVLQLDRLPKVGDHFNYRSGDKLFKVVVTKADNRKATEINMRVFDSPSGEEEREHKWV